MTAVVPTARVRYGDQEIFANSTYLWQAYPMAPYIVCARRSARPRGCVETPIALSDPVCFSPALGATLCFKGDRRPLGAALIQNGLRRDSATLCFNPVPSYASRHKSVDEREEIPRRGEHQYSSGRSRVVTDRSASVITQSFSVCVTW
jgi:hypothetical protein